MTEVYPGQEAKADAEKWKYRYVEHLRFIGLIYGDHPLVGTPVTLSFERGEWKQGKNLISAIMLRRQEIEGTPQQVPLWAQVWRFSPQFRDQGQNRKWYGFGFEPADPCIVSLEDADNMLALHKEFKELFEQQRLVVQDEPTEKPEDPAAVAAEDQF
jgi:hypothetical protein